MIENAIRRELTDLRHYVEEVEALLSEGNSYTQAKLLLLLRKTNDRLNLLADELRGDAETEEGVSNG